MQVASARRFSAGSCRVHPVRSLALNDQGTVSTLERREGIVTGSGGSPSVRRRRLGAELRRHREARGLTMAGAALWLDCSTSKISRIETAQTGASPHDVERLLALYQVPDADAQELIEIAGGTRQRGWWQPYGSMVTGAFIAFEAAAAAI